MTLYLDGETLTIEDIKSFYNNNQRLKLLMMR
ncbi:Uncharacterised protein [Staphylococcus aureus]|uniref:Uncharacterized protein n=1 Tax=Staphylococcus aureus TaxID=1280 RepID=A0A380DPR0_STAAU|nr:Uncharacterised protein [Staphylococcus aureus]